MRTRRNECHSRLAQARCEGKWDSSAGAGVWGTNDAGDELSRTPLRPSRVRSYVIETHSPPCPQPREPPQSDAPQRPIRSIANQLRLLQGGEFGDRNDLDLGEEHAAEVQDENDGKLADGSDEDEESSDGPLPPPQYQPSRGRVSVRLDSGDSTSKMGKKAVPGPASHMVVSSTAQEEQDEKLGRKPSVEANCREELLPGSDGRYRSAGMARLITMQIELSLPVPVPPPRLASSCPILDLEQLSNSGHGLKKLMDSRHQPSSDAGAPLAVKKGGRSDTNTSTPASLAGSPEHLLPLVLAGVPGYEIRPSLPSCSCMTPVEQPTRRSSQHRERALLRELVSPPGLQPLASPMVVALGHRAADNVYAIATCGPPTGPSLMARSDPPLMPVHAFAVPESSKEYSIDINVAADASEPTAGDDADVGKDLEAVVQAAKRVFTTLGGMFQAGIGMVNSPSARVPHSPTPPPSSNRLPITPSSDDSPASKAAGYWRWTPVQAVPQSPVRVGLAGSADYRAQDYSWAGSTPAPPLSEPTRTTSRTSPWLRRLQGCSASNVSQAADEIATTPRGGWTPRLTPRCSASGTGTRTSSRRQVEI